MDKKIITNNLDLEFKDLTAEEYRVYIFPKDEQVYIEKPIALNVSNNGHRVVDSEGLTYYIPYGWIALIWENKEGEPRVNF